jgi:hypothetical protein
MYSADSKDLGKLFSPFRGLSVSLSSSLLGSPCPLGLSLFFLPLLVSLPPPISSSSAAFLLGLNDIPWWDRVELDR